MSKPKTEINWPLFRKALSQLKPYRGWIAFNLIVSLGSATVDVASGFFIQSITDAAIQHDLQSVMRMVILVAFVVLIGIQLKFLVKYTTGCFTGRAVYDIRAKVMASIHKMPFHTIEKYHSGDVISRLSNDTYALQSFLQNNFSDLIYQPMILVGVFTYLVFINWKLTLISFIVTIISLFIFGKLSKPIGMYAKDIQAGHGIVNSLAQEVISGIRTVKAYNLEPYFFKTFKLSVDRLFDSYLKKNKRSSFLMPLQFLTDLFPLLCTMTMGSFLALRGEITLGSFMAFLYMLHHLSDPLTIIPELIQEVRSVAASINRVNDLTDITEERTDGSEFLPSCNEPVIEFKKVWFGYHENQDILKDLSFVILSNSKTAIVGKSGSGKSTIFKLVCGFYPPQCGETFLYGHSYPTWNLKSLRSQMSLVTQDTFLFPGTILENLSFGRPGASEAELIEAAKVANAHEFIMSFPEGYQTFVGERGNRLSGGQKQRIAIARAFLKNAPILLLDEPTSALDYGSEALIMEGIDRISQNKTVIVVAHRLSTIQTADQILVLDDGKVVEMGNHQSLVESNGYYHELYSKQFAG